MNQKAEQERKPKLRFPEFREKLGWQKETLGKLFSERQESGYLELPLLSLTDKDGIIPQENSKRKNNASVDKSRYLRTCPGDIVYNTMRMWEGRSALSSIEGIVSPAYTVCLPNNDISGCFFSYYFKTRQMVREFRKYSQGLVNDTLNLKFEAFSNIPIFAPILAEQHKIADCLSSIDEVIDGEAQKLEKLKAHKRGLLQVLFPDDGNAIPIIRFPEFQNAPMWKEMSFSTFVQEIESGVSVNSLDRSVKSIEEVGILKTSCISDGIFYPALNKKVVQGEILLTKVNPKKNSIILSRMNTPALVGESGYIEENVINLFLPDRLWQITCDEELSFLVNA